MDFISLELLQSLPVPDQTKIKVGIIETNDLSMIPPSYLPPVHSRDYYFVSYSHRDYKLVYRDIFALQENGLNLWYDRGIPAGRDWRDVANKFMGPAVCRGVLFYVSETSLLSDAVFDELEYAKNHGKAIFSLNLPMTSDYTHKGQSVKGKVFGACEMVDILLENGVAIDPERAEFIKSCFPPSVLFLPVSMDAKQRYEKISSSTMELPKIWTSYKEKGWYYADYPTDPMIESIELEDLDAFKTKPNAKTAMGRCAFSNCANLLSAHVAAHSLNDYAFYHCANLRSFKNTPNANSDKILCWDAVFMCCTNLVDIDIAQFDYIGDEAFSTCEGLEEIHIEAEHVGNSAFYRCHNLKRVHIGPKVAFIGKAAFDRCYALQWFEVDPNNAHFYSKNGFLYQRQESGEDILLYEVPYNKKH
ncbi:MAG: leucine-rich repeat protein [Bacilli bacterium]|nr:leucine-rich repeat protein [Bacilli bacterium]